MKMRWIWLLAAGMHSAWASADSELAPLRKLAAGLLKRGDLGGAGAFCEFAPTCQVHGCSGPQRNSVRHIAHAKGLIETWYYRSPGEAGGPIGRYQGRLKPGQWRDLLGKLSRMRWDAPSKGVPAPPPLPPGPLESIQVLTLTDGNASASFSFAGHASESIDAAFDQLGILAQSETDTLWELSLAEPQAKVRKDSLIVSARWNWRGPAGARLLFSPAAGGEYCGQARFKWYLDTSSFTADWHRGESPQADRAQAWTLAPGKGPVFTIGFPYNGPTAGKAKRMGALDGIGIRLLVPGAADTVSGTLFTDAFPF